MLQYHPTELNFQILQFLFGDATQVHCHLHTNVGDIFFYKCTSSFLTFSNNKMMEKL